MAHIPFRLLALGLLVTSPSLAQTTPTEEPPPFDKPVPPGAPGGDAVLPAPAPEQNAVTPPPGATPDAARAAEAKAIAPVFAPPVDRPPVPKREKLQVTSIGMRLGAVDFGAEADIVSSVGRLKPPPDNRRWAYALRGFFRAPMRVGIGPETGKTTGSQWHSPPRIVGFGSDEWSYANLAPGGTGQIELAVTNQRVEGHVILAGDIFADAAYPHLDKLGGFSQAWVTLKAPALIGTRGGMALNVGAFSERFGAAGPFQQSTGYYGTYLFGRTHVAGESLVLDLDLSSDLELVVEHGIGAKVEVVPYSKEAPVAPYLPNQGPVPQGSNFVHHAHVNLLFQDWLSFAAHYLTSWSPNDLQEVTRTPAKEARMTVMGAELHSDHPVAGSGYVGYSYVDAKSILPLSDGVQVLHGANGAGFKNNYFGALPASAQASLAQGLEDSQRDDSGKLHTVLFQYILRAAPLFGRKEPGPDVALGVFGMYNHVDTVKHDLNGMLVPAGYAFKQDKVKVGAELQVAPIEPLSIGVRFDSVMPDGGKEDVAYRAISPRIVLHSKWIGREYVILNYTRYILGKDVHPSAPYSQPNPPSAPLASVTKPDENLFSLTAMVAF